MKNYFVIPADARGIVDVHRRFWREVAESAGEPDRLVTIVNQNDRARRASDDHIIKRPLKRRRRGCRAVGG